MVARILLAGGVQAVLQALRIGRRIVKFAIEPGPGGHVDLAPQDGFHGQVPVLVPGLLAGVHEFHDPEHVAVVGHRHGIHAGGLALLDEFRDPGHAVQQGILGMEMQMGEAHGSILPRLAPSVGSSFSASVPPDGTVYPAHSNLFAPGARRVQ